MDGLRDRLGRALTRLDMLAERDNQARWVIHPEDDRIAGGGGGFWSFSDGHVLFRFSDTIGGPPASLPRWVRIKPDWAGALGGADRRHTRITRSDWREFAGPLPSTEASRWGEGGIDVVWFLPDVALNARLFRLALMPTALRASVTIDVANGAEPIWLHGVGWSAAVAPLRVPIPRVRSERSLWKWERLR